MLTINEYTVELLKDPFGIIEGERYEFLIYIEIPEDDELYRENGVYVKALYGVFDTDSKLIKYDIIENETNIVLDFELEEDEEKYIAMFCSTHLNKENE